MADEDTELPPLHLTTRKTTNKSHIQIKDPTICKTKCEDKPCTYYCPTKVYTWQEAEQKIKVNYSRCIECLACPYGCPYNNIAWEFPQNGYGVNYTADN